MTKDDIDKLWHQAMSDSIKNGEDFTRYRFANLVAKHEREACLDAMMQSVDKGIDTAMVLEREACAKVAFDGYDQRLDGDEIGAAIRARETHD